MLALLIGAHSRIGQTLPATLPGSLCLQFNHRSTSGLQPVSSVQWLTQSSPLSQCSDGLRCPCAPSAHSANVATTYPAHSSVAHSCLHRRTGHSPPPTSTTAGQSLRLNPWCYLVTALRCKRALIWSQQPQLH